MNRIYSKPATDPTAQKRMLSTTRAVWHATLSCGASIRDRPALAPYERNVWEEDEDDEAHDARGFPAKGMSHLSDLTWHTRLSKEASLRGINHANELIKW